jgi:hypothetical protein
MPGHTLPRRQSIRTRTRSALDAAPDARPILHLLATALRFRAVLVNGDSVVASSGARARSPECSQHLMVERDLTGRHPDARLPADPRTTVPGARRALPAMALALRASGASCWRSRAGDAADAGSARWNRAGTGPYGRSSGRPRAVRSTTTHQPGIRESVGSTITLIEQRLQSMNRVRGLSIRWSRVASGATGALAAAAFLLARMMTRESVRQDRLQQRRGISAAGRTRSPARRNCRN